MKSRVYGSVSISLDDSSPTLAAAIPVVSQLMAGDDFFYMDNAYVTDVARAIDVPFDYTSYVYVQNLGDTNELFVYVTDLDGNLVDVMLAVGRWTIISGVDSSTHCVSLACDNGETTYARVFAVGGAALGHETGEAGDEDPVNG